MRYLTNLTRANEIGANSYLLEMEGYTILLDAGMHPKKEGMAATPLYTQTQGKKLDAIFISHAHLDHLGTLPLFARLHPQAKIFMSEPTTHLSDPLLHNSVNIMKKKTQSQETLPLFSHAEVDQIQKRWFPCALEKKLSLNGEPASRNEFSFEMFDAGHILGSVGLRFNSAKGNFFYTGDVNFDAQEISYSADFPKDEIDTLLIETTRGATDSSNYCRKAELERLAKSINTVIERNGAILIPAFALGKTQETLVALYHMMQEGIIPPCPISIGGLSWNISTIYDRLAKYYPRLSPKLKLIDDIKPRLVNGKNVRKINPQRGHIYLLSSGMMTQHTLSNLVAQHFLTDPRHAIFFIGYTDPDSPAGQLKSAFAENKSVTLDPEEGEQPIRCEIDCFDLTAHAQREDILNYIIQVNPRHVLLIHGDEPALEWFQTKIREARPKMKITIPLPGETISF
ncbi:MAG: MBL fold metallo-hydrolase [Verrucomicrobiae bacterium]|nr:MBL fold metallo-hydrolase [Verrucomicrobiae bacterium]